MQIQTRLHSLDFDPVVVVIAVVVAIAAFTAGAGAWAILAGAVTLAAASVGKSVFASLAHRFALPQRGSPERALVLRSRSAAATMDRICRSVPAGPLAERGRLMERAARSALPTIRDLAVQAAYVASLASAMNLEQLELEQAQSLQQLAAAPDDRLRLELESSLRSTEAQLGTARRLRALAGELGARTRALTISMEAVAAGLTELLALSAGDPTVQPFPTLTTLAREIDALRGGLDEAQNFGRQAAAIHFLED